MAFIFGGNTGMSYEQMMQARNFADEARRTYQAPQNVGEGLGSIFANIGAGLMDRRANKAEAKGKEEFGSVFSEILRERLGGGVSMSSMGSTPPTMEQRNEAMAANGGPTQAAADSLGLIREFEGFRETPYWDVNAHRTGYGSDTITNPDGTVRKVQPGDKVTREQAELDLQRRVETEFEPAVQRAVGAEAFASLNAGQKAALTSIAYNYGRVPDSVAEAVRSGDAQAASQAIVRLSTHNEGINAGRRQREAQIYAGGYSGGGIGSGGAGAGMDPRIIEAMQNPYASDAQRSALGMLLQQQMQASDPVRQMEMEAAQLELEKLRNPQVEPIEINGQLIDPSTGEVLGDYRTPDAGPKPTDDIREYEFARQQGYEGSFQDFMLEGRKAGATNVTVGGESEVGTIPQGFELVTDPETGARQMRPIPGGPADSSQQKAVQESNAGIASETIVSAAQRAREAAGERTFGGLAGRALAYDPSTRNAEVYRQTEVLKSNAKIENLTAMRMASPTGGALGSVTEKESQMLADKSGSLDPASPNYLRDLDDYEKTLLRIVHGKEAGDRLYEETRPQAPAKPPEVPQPAAEPTAWNGPSAAAIRQMDRLQADSVLSAYERNIEAVPDDVLDALIEATK